jgi:hypothetical protein
MRKWRVTVTHDDGYCSLRLHEWDGGVGVLRGKWTLTFGGVLENIAGLVRVGIPSPLMWFKPMPARIALAVKWAIAKVRSLEDDDDVKAQAEVLAAGWTKAAQAMFAEGLGKGASE